MGWRVDGEIESQLSGVRCQLRSEGLRLEGVCIVFE